MPATAPEKSYIGESSTVIEKIAAHVSVRPMMFALLLFVLALVLPYSHLTVDPGVYLSVHLLFEIVSIVVCFAVFASVSYGFQQTKNHSDLLLGLALAMSGLFDLAHALSFEGMPDVLGTNSVGLAAAYWIMARLVTGVGVILASLAGNRSGMSSVRTWKAVWVGMGFVAVTIAVFSIYSAQISELFYDTGAKSLTHLKIGLEGTCIALFVVGVVLIGRKTDWDKHTVKVMRTALIIAILAEVLFCWYRSPYDWYNASGHILKTFAYLCILSAVFAFALQKPYVQLTEAQRELRRLLDDARDSRKELERSFSRMGTALSASVRVSEAALIIAQLAREFSHSDCAVVKVHSNTKIDAQQVCSGQLGPCPGLTQLAEEYAPKAIEEQKPVPESFDKNPLSTVCLKGDEHRIQHMLSHALVHEGKVLGAISLFRQTNIPFGPEDINRVNIFAPQAGGAIHNAMSFEREQHIASILQDYIARIPPFQSEKYEVGYLYKPIMEEAEVGGDFLDVIRMPDNKLGLVIGDVAGKGLEAAVHTTMLKFAIKAFLSEGHSPAQIAERLENLVPDFVEDDCFITLFVGVLDKNTGNLVYTNAGHEPPILCKKNICGSLIPTGPVLGVGLNVTFSEASVVLEKGDTMLMFTDGLIERGDGMPQFSVDTVANIIKNADGGDCNKLVESVYEASRSSESGEPKDDVAVLGIKAL